MDEQAHEPSVEAVRQAGKPVRAAMQLLAASSLNSGPILPERRRSDFVGNPRQYRRRKPGCRCCPVPAAPGRTRSPDLANRVGTVRGAPLSAPQADVPAMRTSSSSSPILLFLVQAPHGGSICALASERWRTGCHLSTTTYRRFERSGPNFACSIFASVHEPQRELAFPTLTPRPVSLSAVLKWFGAQRAPLRYSGVA